MYLISQELSKDGGSFQNAMTSIVAENDLQDEADELFQQSFVIYLCQQEIIFTLNVSSLLQGFADC